MNHKIHPSLWADTAVSAPALSPLEEKIQADVVIIGAGFTGLRTALELASKGLDVVVLEAQEPGWGASGRTGGQVNPLAHETPDKICRRLGQERGQRVVKAYIDSADEVFSLIDKYDMKCDAERNGWLRAAHCKKAVAQLEIMQKAWSAEGLDIGYVEGVNLHRMMGTDTYDVATLTPSGGSVQPLSYTRELLRVALNNGAKVYSRSAVKKVENTHGKWRVETDTAQVISKWVVFCTNGYTDNLLPGLKKTIVPLVSLQAATAPLPDDLYEEILSEGNSFADTRRVIFYGRKLSNKRVVFGTLGSTQDCKSRSDINRLNQGVSNTFPKLKGIPLEYMWGGKIAHTPDILPHLHEPEKGLIAGLGYNGRGVAMATVMGRVISERILGKAESELDFPITGYRTAWLRHFSDIAVKGAVPVFEVLDSLENRLF